MPGESGGIRSLFEKGSQRSDRNMALCDVALDQSCVTRDRIGRKTNLGLERDEALIIQHLDFGSVVL
jgi:hypothetical protein